MIDSSREDTTHRAKVAMPRSLLGQRFGRWTVIERAENSSRGEIRWIVRCDCATAAERTVYASHLTQGRSQSCGCLQRETASSRRTHGGSSTPEYEVWRAMRRRCSVPGTPEFKRYGGRGITVCERWSEFSAFLADMGRRPSQKHSIDRIKNDGNYEPGNCRWATRQEQARNQRNNTRLTFRGETLILVEWAERTGLKSEVIGNRLRRGWSIEQALTSPAGTR